MHSPFNRSPTLSPAFLEIKIFFVSLLYLQCLRLAFLLSFGDLSFQLTDFAAAALAGLHYDVKLAFALFCSLLIVSALSTFIPMLRAFSTFLRWAAMTGFVFLTTLITAASHEFFLEYNSNFDIRVFDGVHDDHLAILNTTLKTYHLIEWVTGVLAITFIYALFLHKRLISLLSRPTGDAQPPSNRKTLVYLTITALFTGAGFLVSFGSLEADAKSAISFPSKILSASVIPSPIALYKATYEYRLKLRAYKTGLYDRPKLNQAITTLTATSSDAQLAQDLDQFFTKKTTGDFQLPKRPKHIFLVVMERYDAWPLKPEYASLNVTNGLKSLLKKSVHFQNFMPGSTTTMPSLQVILLGLPYIGLEAQHFTETTYPGAIAKQMAELGYKPRFIYGGFLSWAKVGLVARAQGFTEIHGVDEQITQYQEKNEWGIDDGSLFNHIAKTVETDPTPSFNLIMTSTNHPPYDLPLDRHNVPQEQIGKALDGLGISNGSRATNINRVGHLWYSDKMLTDFITKMQSREPGALFAITGDHFSRAHFNLGASLHEQNSVPFALIGADSLTPVQYDPQKPGSHLDIAPTLIELLAPEGYEYFSLGHSLLGKNHPDIAFGADNAILTKGHIFKKEAPEAAQTLSGEEISLSPEQIDLNKAQLRALEVVTWWRMIRGNNLE